jgi:hypothetical protein
MNTKKKKRKNINWGLKSYKQQMHSAVFRVRVDNISSTLVSKELGIPVRTLRRYINFSKKKTNPFYIKVEEIEVEEDDTPKSWKPMTTVPRFKINVETKKKKARLSEYTLVSDSFRDIINPFHIFDSYFFNDDLESVSIKTDVDEFEEGLSTMTFPVPEPQEIICLDKEMEASSDNPITLKHKRRKTKCKHGRRKAQCKKCGGSSICMHGRRKAECKECGGNIICIHDCIKYTCKKCGGSRICMHGRQKYTCKECGGKGICKHGRHKAQCKECGGRNICKHGRRKSRCKEC